MKPLLFLAVLLTGCASESYSLGSPKRAAHGRIQGDATNVTVIAKPNYYYFHADRLDNSTATKAGAFVIQKTGAAATQVGSVFMTGGVIP